MATSHPVVFAPSLLPAGRWSIDPKRSSVRFRVRHFQLAAVEGRFTEFQGSFDDAGATGSVEVASIETGHDIRDERLRSADFFDVEHHPRMTFAAAAPIADVVDGRLTIKAVPRTLRFDLQVQYRQAPALHARTVISRKTFGLDWRGLRDAGRLIVSDRVELLLELALVRR